MPVPTLTCRGRPPFRGQFFDRYFDQGSGVITRVDATTFRIAPHISAYGFWGWWAVRWDKLGGQTPHFLISKTSVYNLSAGMWWAAWAAASDTDTWHLFDNMSIGASDFEFYNNSAFPAGPIYISTFPMYPLSRMQRKIAEWQADGYVSDTTSSTDGVIDLSTSRALGDGSGRVIAALPFYGFKISSGAGTKNNVILGAMSHATETPGPYMLEAAVDWLLGGSVLAEFLLKYCNFFVYPCLNPQGVWGGWFRSSPELPGTSHDWVWDAGSAGLEESVDAFKAAMNTDTSGAIEVGFDYHSYYSNQDVHGEVNTGDTTGNYSVYTSELNALDAGFDLQDMDLSKASAVYFKSLGASLAMTIEQDMGTGRGVAEWKAFGEKTLQALANMVKKGYLTTNPGIGARSFNGTTDRVDWASVANLKDHALTISLWIYIDAIPTNGYMFCIHQSGDAAVSIYFNVSHTDNDYISFGVLGSTAMQRASVAGFPTTGAWLNFIATWDGVITNATGVHLYKGNVESSSYSVTTNGATSVTATGKWSIGGRYYDDSRNIDAKIAQVGAWDAVLDSTARANLAAGYSPALVAASNLKFYFKGNTSSLYNEVSGGGNGTADGTSQLTGVGTGPAIIY